MKCFASLLSAIALAALVSPAYGQAGGGGGGAGGAAGAGGQAGGAAGAGGQAGVGGQAQGGVKQPGIQAGAQVGARPGGAQAGAQVGVQPGAGVQGQAGANFGGMRQQPWFNPRVIRQRLNLNDDQFSTLNRSYTEYWNRYNRGMSELGRDLNEQQRMQRLRELEGNFQRDFSTATDRVFTDPRQRDRFNQLYLQYQGYGAFNDPRIQTRLNLTPQQRQRLNELNTEWNIQMGRMGSEFRTGDQGISNRLRNMRTEFDKRFHVILNDEQRQNWQSMTGDPFDFPADVYFQSDTDARTNAGTVNGTTNGTINRPNVTNGRNRTGQKTPATPQIPR